MPLSPAARVRRFNRAVTAEVGALDDSFLGRGRPLGAARVLNAIGPDGTEVAAVRQDLGLDSGLMSRLLRTLEAEGLVTVTAGRPDRRHRIARLTPKGAKEKAAYDRLSDGRAMRLLAAQGRNAGALLEAMDLIASALLRDRIELAETDPEAPDAAWCLSRYYETLAERFDAGFDLARNPNPDPAAFRPPRGSFLVARSDGLPLGCVALAGDGGPAGEVKRLWVAPAARGQGLARRLMEAIEARARALGMTALRLDTNRNLTEAIALYRATGWQDIPRYNDNPYAHRWFGKAL